MLLQRTHNRIIVVLLIALAYAGTAGPLQAGVFGRVVPTDGHASDLALDEARGVLYIAAFTANRIDVMSTTDYTIGQFMSVPGHPGSLALSPDGRFLVVTLFGNPADGSSTGNALTVIDLRNGTRQTYGLPSTPLAAAFGIDGRALVLTTTDFLLFDPVSGNTQTVDTVANVTAKTLPVEAPTFPPDVTTASMTALRDGTKIYGVTDHLLFSYKVDKNPQIIGFGYTATPPLGPRVISLSQDGRSFMTGWGLFGCGEGFLGECNAGGPLVAQLPGFTGKLNVGTVAFRSSTNTIYAQGSLQNPAPPAPQSQTVCFPDGRCVTETDAPSNVVPASTVPPALIVMDSDNLTVRERIQLPESLAGKSVFKSDESVLFSISDSGVTVFDMAQLQRAPRVAAAQDDVVIRGSFCDRRPLTQEINIVDPNGGSVPFSICAKSSATGCDFAGLTVSPQAGVTPAKVQITVDPQTLQLGTSPFVFEIRSAFAVNMPPPPLNGAVETDYTANVRGRFRVLVNNREPEYRGSFLNVPGTLVDILADPQRDRVYILRQDKNQVLVYDSNTFSQIATLRTSNTPTQMAITFDRQYLLVGHENSQLAYVFDLNTLQPTRPIAFPLGHYPRSIAASGNAILAASRVVGTVNTIDRVDMVTRTAAPMPSLGVFKNDVHVKTTLSAAPNGGAIFAAMPDGRVMLYNSGADTFTFARKDVSALQGAYAASSFGRYVVDRYVLNDSLVQIGTLTPASEVASGSVFVDQFGFHTAASAGAGTIRRFDPASSLTPGQTLVVESPLRVDADNPFRRTLATLYNRTAIVSLTTSGFTVLPWSYDAAQAPPRLDRIVSAADNRSPVAPGSLVSIFGQQLSPVSIAAGGVANIGDSCLTVNGVVVPIIFVSSTQINAQLPYQVDGNASLVLRTPGGTSDGLNFTILPAAPSIFRSATAGPDTGLPTLYRDGSADLVTVSNPIRPQDQIVIILTGMGRTSPSVDAGVPAPSDPIASPIIPATVTLGGVPLRVTFAGLLPGNVGVYEIDATVPFRGVPAGFDVPLTITQGGVSTTLNVRVVE